MSNKTFSLRGLLGVGSLESAHFSFSAIIAMRSIGVRKIGFSSCSDGFAGFVVKDKHSPPFWQNPTPSRRRYQCETRSIKWHDPDFSVQC